MLKAQFHKTLWMTLHIFHESSSPPPCTYIDAFSLEHINQRHFTPHICDILATVVFLKKFLWKRELFTATGPSAGSLQNPTIISVDCLFKYSVLVFPENHSFKVCFIFLKSDKINFSTQISHPKIVFTVLTKVCIFSNIQ